MVLDMDRISVYLSVRLLKNVTKICLEEIDDFEDAYFRGFVKYFKNNLIVILSVNYIKIPGTRDSENVEILQILNKYPTTLYGVLFWI